MINRLVVFLIIQFGALVIGGLFTRQAVTSDWYLHLQKAPWTPPGWFFGFAWTTIMICFSLLLALLWPKIQNKKEAAVTIAIQWILNVIWNPVFFYFHQILSGAVILIMLLGVLLWFYKKYAVAAKLEMWLLVPYLVWLVVASSLNLYILCMN